MLYSHWAVTGIYFGMPSTSEIENALALPLVDVKGDATEAGEMIDQMLSETWISRGNLKTNEQGSVNTRVFCGLYDLSATLADGQVAYTSVYVPNDPQHQANKTVVISPLAVSLEPMR